MIAIFEVAEHGLDHVLLAISEEHSHERMSGHSFVSVPFLLFIHFSSQLCFIFCLLKYRSFHFG